MNCKKITLSLLLSTTTFSVLADPEKTNCRNETISQKSIYQGYTSCVAEFWYTTYEKGKLERKKGAKTLTEDVSISDQPTKRLNGIAEIQVTGITGTLLTERHVVSCLAQVPFSHKEDIIAEVCDYKPTARLNFTDKPYMTFFSVNANDVDGSIVDSKIWIDNILATSTYVSGNPGDIFRLKATVTDNDGYTYTTYDSIRIKSVEEICGNRYCDW